MSFSLSMVARSQAAPILLPGLVRWHRGRPSRSLFFATAAKKLLGDFGELPGTPFKPAAEPQQQKPSGLGLTLAPAPNNQGVAVTDVDPNGIAAAKGLTAGDIILDVSNNPVRTPADVHKAISRAQDSGKRDIVLRVRTRNGGIQFMALPVPSERPTLWGRIQSWLRSL